jgi:CubicO group peptidase (beta-lactamase class C family)
MPELDALARAAIVESGVAPACVVCAMSRGEDGWHLATGAAGRRSHIRPGAVEPETPFDLASVTKPFVASIAARLVRSGRLAWETTLGALLPELSETASGSVALTHFLSHRAGLEAHRGLFLPLVDGKRVEREGALRAAALARREECVGALPEHGFAPLYSDLGYLLAGEAIARRAGADLDRVLGAEVRDVLGLDVASAETWRRSSASFDERVAPTEVVGWRGGEIAGAVHDENAWALSGFGLSGHAGSFGTAASVARFGAALLDALAGRRIDWLSETEARHLVEPRPGGTLRTGFDGRSDEGSSAGSLFGARSFGHLGFTGTSLWCDPDTDIVAVILTNRVSPTRDNLAIRAARPAVNDALFRVALDRAASRGRGLRKSPPRIGQKPE